MDNAMARMMLETINNMMLELYASMRWHFTNIFTDQTGRILIVRV